MSRAGKRKRTKTERNSETTAVEDTNIHQGLAAFTNPSFFFPPSSISAVEDKESRN